MRPEDKDKLMMQLLGLKQRELVDVIDTLRQELSLRHDVMYSPCLVYPMYEVLLHQCGENRVLTLKVIRECMECGLVEAQNIARKVSLVEPQIIKSGIFADEAEAICIELRQAGAKAAKRPVPEQNDPFSDLPKIA